MKFIWQKPINRLDSMYIIPLILSWTDNSIKKQETELPGQIGNLDNHVRLQATREYHSALKSAPFSKHWKSKWEDEITSDVSTGFLS